MISVIQRVKHANVTIQNNVFSKINQGIVILLGVASDDTNDDIEWLANKIVNLRIFDDENGIMNHSCIEKSYEIMVVSQFTLHARTKKGNRPSYIEAAKPEIAKETYELFVKKLKSITNSEIKTGCFRENMEINLCNDGPVTIIIDSKNKK